MRPSESSLLDGSELADSPPLWFDDEGWQELLKLVKNISEGVDEQNALHLL